MRRGEEFLLSRVEKGEAAPKHKRSWDVDRFIEAYRLLEEVSLLLPLPEVGQLHSCPIWSIPCQLRNQQYG
jgi:hypothetical protein